VRKLETLTERVAKPWEWASVRDGHSFHGASTEGRSGEEGLIHLKMLKGERAYARGNVGET
jgi:hypothetical protein